MKLVVSFFISTINIIILIIIIILMQNSNNNKKYHEIFEYNWNELCISEIEKKITNYCPNNLSFFNGNFYAILSWNKLKKDQCILNEHILVIFYFYNYLKYNYKKGHILTINHHNVIRIQFNNFMK